MFEYLRDAVIGFCSSPWRARRPVVLVSCVGILAGCARVEPQADFARTRELISERTGAETVYDPDAEVLSADDIERMLADGLTVEAAVHLALLNNRRLQAEFMAIGAAKADLAQAGFLSNPTLAFSAQFPEGGGRSNIQASLAQNIADLWQIPKRKKAADAGLQETILRVAHFASSLTQETKIDYYRAKAAEELLIVAEKNLELVTRSFEAVRAQREAGTASLLDENLSRGQALSAELGVRNARLEAANSKRTLARRLSLSQNVDSLVLVDALPELTATPLTAEDAIELARESRLDVQAIAQSAEALFARMELEKRKVFPDLSIGPFMERPDRRALPGRDVPADFVRASLANGALAAPDIQSRRERQQARDQEINFLLGPALSMTLPIFDQNQAQTAKAWYGYLGELKGHEALLVDIAQNVRSAVDVARTTQANAVYYRTEVVPQAMRNLEFASASYTAGQTNILTLLEAQRAALEAQRGLTDSLLEACIGRARLEQEVGRSLDPTP
jgi:cobalt-zinc-cadmium efflux system outer membrane protein